LATNKLELLHVGPQDVRARSIYTVDLRTRKLIERRHPCTLNAGAK
jgi:hypothetical protein